MKKNELVVAETKAVAKVENAKKVNNVLSVSELKALFVACGVTPKYTDSTNYVGCGTRANTFSVNAKKTKYNIYLGDEEFKWVQDSKLEGLSLVKDGNKVDKTRPNYIECKDTAVLKKLLGVILSHNAKVAISK